MAVPLNVSLHPQSGELIIGGQKTVGPKSSEGSPSFTGGSGFTGGDSPSGGPAAGSANSGGAPTAPGATTTTPTLTSLKLDGDDLGTLLFRLNGLNLPLAELAAFIAGLDLPPDELAHLLFELNLPPDALASLIEALDLPPEVVSAVKAELETLEEVEQVIQNWEAANLPLEQLPTFLQQYPELTIDQLGFFLDELYLEPVEVADILAQLSPLDEQLTPIFYELNLTNAEISQLLTPINQITGLPTPWSPPNVLPDAEEGTTTPSGTAVAAAPTANPTSVTQVTVVPQASLSPVTTLTPPPPAPSPAPSNNNEEEENNKGLRIALNDNA